MFFQEERKTPVLPRGVKVDTGFYDADYFKGNIKSNWTSPYNWNSFGNLFARWARFIMDGFPECRSFLNVGCATGMFERAMIETAELNRITQEVYGFDPSPYAVPHAERSAKPFLQQVGVEEFEFKRKYDLLLSFDVFEHLTPQQSEDFLTRARPFIKRGLFFAIALDVERHRDEPSHINLQAREWWETLFKKCGWVQGENEVLRERYAKKHRFIQNGEYEVFIYNSGVQ